MRNLNNFQKETFSRFYQIRWIFLRKRWTWTIFIDRSFINLKYIKKFYGIKKFQAFPMNWQIFLMNNQFYWGGLNEKINPMSNRNSLISVKFEINWNWSLWSFNFILWIIKIASSKRENFYPKRNSDVWKKNDGAPLDTVEFFCPEFCYNVKGLLVKKRGHSKK